VQFLKQFYGVCIGEGSQFPSCATILQFFMHPIIFPLRNTNIYICIYARIQKMYNFGGWGRPHLVLITYGSLSMPKFIRITRGIHPLEAKLYQKFQILTNFGAVFTRLCTDKVHCACITWFFLKFVYLDAYTCRSH